MNAQTMLGMLHAQELLLISVIRALPPETRRTIADDFHAQVERTETPHLDAAGRDASEAFTTHIRRLSILLASFS